MTYLVTVPPTADQGSYKTKVDSRADALWDYNRAREHDGLPPLSRMPAGTRYQYQRITQDESINNPLRGVNKMKAKVLREFYAIRYRHSVFGARPDLTHPDMVANLPELSENRYIVQSFDNMTDAYLAAHTVLGTVLTDGPLAGRSICGGDVEVLRVMEHEPVSVDDGLGLFSSTKTVSMTITGIDVVCGIPHFAIAPLSRYNPVNGWDVPDMIDVI